MKIAHVITRMIVGGAQENTLDSVRGLQTLGGYDVTLLTGPETGPEGDLLALCPWVKPRVVIVRWLVRNISPLRDVAAFFTLLKIFRREKFDVVHTHSSKAGILGRFAARIAGVPRVVHTVHGFAIGPYQSNFLNNFYAWLERLAALKTDVLICVSDSLCQEAKKLGLRPRHIACVESGFDWEMFENARQRRGAIRTELGLEEEDLVVITVARFFPLKGHDRLFEAMGPLLEKYSRLKFILVGDGRLKRHFQDVTYARGWNERVLFTGLVAPARVADYLGASDVLVHTSLREGLARVIPQAFACSLPVISCDIPGACDLVKDKVSGFLIGSSGTEELMSVLEGLLADQSLRCRMGERGHDLAKESYSLDKMVQSLDKIYRRIL